MSDFEVDLAAAFGLAWEPSTDADVMPGGSSTVEIVRVEGGSQDSAGAMRMRGEVSAGTRVWAGANFFPDSEREPVNLSGKHRLRFSARGTPGSHAMLFFGTSPMPAMVSFELADPSVWTVVEIDLGVKRVPSSELVFVFVGTTTPGPFELWIDDVRFD